MPFATRTLEFDKIRARLAEHTAFSAGRELALALEPTADPAEAERRQAGTAEALKLADLKPELGLAGARDVRPQVQRAGLGGVLLPDELLDIAGVVRCSRRWRATLLRLADVFPTLAESGRRLSDHRPLLEEIEAAIAESGEVLDSASPELKRIRTALRAAHERVRTRLQEIITSAATRTALQDPIITERNGRFVVPVKAEARGKLRGIVHDQSASGQTLFVEPLEVVELGNRARQLQAEEQHEIERILRALSRLVAVEADELDQGVVALAELDLQVSKGRLAAAMRAGRPRLASFEHRTPNEPVIRLLQARHPLLGPGAVPLDLELGAEFDLLIITGPNTGGKTVALKTIGLLTLMAQAGLQLPAAEGCLVTVFRSVHADIGDEQSIEQSLSTFSSHVSHIVEMLRDADDRSLVLLDELGAGTDPQEGSALARALLEHLRQRRVYCVATTHYSDLKLYAHTAPRVENASVEFDPATLGPTYRLLVGLPGRSNALEIATRLGLPRVIVDRARAALDPADVEAGNLLDQIQRERQAAQDARIAAERDRQAAAQARADLERRLAEAQRDRQRAWQQAEDASRQLLADLRRDVESLRAEAQRSRAEPAVRGQRQADAERLAARAASLAPVSAPAEVRAAPEPLPPPELVLPAGPLRVGAELVVPSLGVPGTITRLEPGEVEVDVRGIRVRLRPEELTGARAPSGRERAESRRDAPATLKLSDRPRDLALQLDLRGQRRDEAADELDRYLNDAYLSGLRSVRIVHGKGTGAVRQAVHQLLDTHPLVKRHTPATREAGGDGATEVELAL
jgi:DNA mismatch repair protein MutS2